MMKTQIKHELYESPEIEIIEMNSVQVICASYDGNPANMGWGDDNGSNWN